MSPVIQTSTTGGGGNVQKNAAAIKFVLILIFLFVLAGDVLGFLLTQGDRGLAGAPLTGADNVRGFTELMAGIASIPLLIWFALRRLRASSITILAAIMLLHLVVFVFGPDSDGSVDPIQSLSNLVINPVWIFIFFVLALTTAYLRSDAKPNQSVAKTKLKSAVFLVLTLIPVAAIFYVLLLF